MGDSVLPGSEPKAVLTRVTYTIQIPIMTILFLPGLRAEDVERGAVHRGGARAAADAALEGDHLRPGPPRVRRQGPPGPHPARQCPQEGSAG